ncbi:MULTISPECIES: NAD regulator [unclassified Brevundimonas]|uniref:NUDIX hydrolase n=1 Tax=unclassified Brevundimonas TaxID=2622653 RepID=UPI000CFA90E4|nr:MULTISPECIES: NAD regulator [unclassified Brevundimonas]PRA26880.1 NAD regulator [Brevundimonas sp. MYb27]PQZ76965.1 NAD regulator [Brevundimonas sp. MYb31]PRB11841.1 NAD regulator [Brevundimonas sp. MYb52]PRB32825.1 NAD regulator [Brevundimonas sp. MYb46]PRB47268.1 NAD regulator [Brevundimonas sp. MYb33]
MAQGGEQGVRIGLSAVVIALRAGQAVVLTTHAADGAPALPFGPFDPARDRTFELALRAFVTEQTGFPLGFVEQLYTFGDAGRASPRATPGPERAREVSVGYLALTAEAPEAPGLDAAWTPAFDIFPWEDWRNGPPAVMATLEAALRAWAADDARRLGRAESLFALTPDRRWNEERVLERYELLYEAGLVAESARDHDRPASTALPDLPMASDHRRIVATALGRLRSKLKYRPVLFDLTPDTFTLSALQAAAEAVAGLSLHKQNFRRGVERAGLVQATGVFASDTGGRPAELFRFVGADPLGGPAPGLTLPGQR